MEANKGKAVYTASSKYLKNGSKEAEDFNDIYKIMTNVPYSYYWMKHQTLLITEFHQRNEVDINV